VKTAYQHAVEASSLLEGVSSYSDRLEKLTADERLQMAVTGGFKKVNADMQFTIDLAQAHALTALALRHSPSERGPA
jgi:hypothetical protein